MNSLEIRQKFFDFFIKKGHTKASSSSLVPAQDPTLLFANAGMNQFKDVFLGKEQRSYTRAVTIQKCMRAGGKHNDLDNVGFTKRHLTFFEMMGNFSFGDYFKKEAIPYAWNFLTQDVGLDKNRLVVSVYKDDDESYDIWHQDMKIPKDRIYRLGASENFWQMADTGPCGPCTEIHVDRGEEIGCGKKDCDPSCNCERFFEVWNVVFMQFDRQPDGTDVPLKQTGVDTGMGLERLCTIVQNVDSVYETDLFMPIINEIQKITGITYDQANGEIKGAFKVLSDHIRATSFAIADGASPSNEGRGYVLRKIIRRAALFEKKLSNKSFFPQLARTLAQLMSPIYPELKTNLEMIVGILEGEIERFSVNLERGFPIMEELFVTHLDKKMIPGSDIFKLYDTFGFPVELVVARAKENGFKIDMDGFEQEMEKQREQSTKKVEYNVDITLDESITTEFTGYREQKNFKLIVESPIVTLICDSQKTKSTKAGQSCWIITEKSPFFVECGGQVDDQGWLEIQGIKISILGLKKINNAIAVLIDAPMSLSVGDMVTSIVDKRVRASIMKNHTATHLLQAALINMFGKQVKQAGSIVTPEYLRFDFTYHKNLPPEEVKQVEKQVNQQIMANTSVHISQTTYKDAISKGVMAIFGEKYNPENVRVIDIPGFSAELCGGTHVERTGDIGPFKITEVSALSAGIRRIVALTGPKAIELMQDNFNAVKNLSQEFKVKPEQVPDAVAKQKEQLKRVQSQIKQLKKQIWQTQVPTWLKNIREVNGVPFLFLRLESYANDDLKEISNALSAKKPGFYFLFSQENGQIIFLSTLSNEYGKNIDFKKFGSWLKECHDLQGGGSPTLIQGGGHQISPSLEAEITNWINNKN